VSFRRDTKNTKKNEVEEKQRLKNLISINPSSAGCSCTAYTRDLQSAEGQYQEQEEKRKEKSQTRTRANV
jgi:hypothetical protein